MIDRADRDKAADVLRRFRDGEITNRQYEKHWPGRSKTDPVFEEMFCQLWFFYSDCDTHKLTAEDDHELPRQVGGIFDRCVLFLQSDLEYAWPACDFGDPSFLFDVPKPPVTPFHWGSCLAILAMGVAAMALLSWLLGVLSETMAGNLLLACVTFAALVFFLISLAVSALSGLVESLTRYFRPRPPPPPPFRPREPKFQPGKEYWPFKDREEFERHQRDCFLYRGWRASENPANSG